MLHWVINNVRKPVKISPIIIAKRETRKRKKERRKENIKGEDTEKLLRETYNEDHMIKKIS
jgi:hypothetical protein